MAVPTLRDHIIDVIASSGYAKINYSPERLEGAARAIGVVPAVLLEACLRRQNRDVKDANLDELPQRKRRGAHRAEIDVLAPDVVLDAIRAEAKKRNLPVSTMLRTLVHSYLMSTYEPAFNGEEGIPRWRLNGHILTDLDKSEYITFVLSKGAKEALSRRVKSRANNLTVAGVTRLLVMEMFEKKIFLPGTYDVVRIVDQSDTPERFAIPSDNSRTLGSGVHGPQARHDALLSHIPRHGDE